MTRLAPALRPADFGPILRDWRHRRRMSQLDLSLESGVSARHLSCLETGKASPSREMILCLGRTLDMPLGEQNGALEAAGFVPVYPQSDWPDEALDPVRMQFERLMQLHSPYPAVILDTYWRVAGTNAAGRLFVPPVQDGQPPASLIDLYLDTPELRARILNWDELAVAFRARLVAEARALGGDAQLQSYIARLDAVSPEARLAGPASAGLPCLALKFDLGDRVLSLMSGLMQMSTPLNIAVTEIKLELFFPADAETEAFFKSMADPAPPR